LEEGDYHCVLQAEDSSAANDDTLNAPRKSVTNGNFLSFSIACSFMHYSFNKHPRTISARFYSLKFRPQPTHHNHVNVRR
jgi:hypothetical protein